MRISIYIVSFVFFQCSSILIAQSNERVIIPFTASEYLQNCLRSGNASEVKFAEYQQQQKQVLGPSDKKSPKRAFLYSLIVPGLGQYYMGRNNTASIFAAAEAAAWLGLIVNNSYSDFLTTEYKTYAVQYASVQRKNKGTRFWSDIGKYDDIYAYNEKRQRERDFEVLYEENNQNYWKWDSIEDRYNYDRKRLHANDISGKKVYYQLAVVVNHLASAIHALYIARKHNKGTEPSSWDMRLDTYGFQSTGRYAGIGLVKRF